MGCTIWTVLSGLGGFLIGGSIVWIGWHTFFKRKQHLIGLALSEAETKSQKLNTQVVHFQEAKLAALEKSKAIRDDLANWRAKAIELEAQLALYQTKSSRLKPKAKRLEQFAGTTSEGNEWSDQDEWFFEEALAEVYPMTQNGKAHQQSSNHILKQDSTHTENSIPIEVVKEVFPKVSDELNELLAEYDELEENYEQLFSKYKSLTQKYEACQRKTSALLEKNHQQNSSQLEEYKELYETVLAQQKDYKLAVAELESELDRINFKGI